MSTTDDRITAGAASYRAWSESITATPEGRAIYEEESEKMDLWLQLAEARQAAGLTQAQLAERLGVSQAQVARIEKRGYDAYTLTTLRRFVRALGDDFAMEVTIRRTEAPAAAAPTDS